MTDTKQVFTDDSERDNFLMRVAVSKCTRFTPGNIKDAKKAGTEISDPVEKMMLGRNAISIHKN